MNLLIIDTYYQGFLNSFYQKQKFTFKTYQSQLNKLLAQSFGTADYYSYYLKKLGHQAEELIVNDKALQLQWSKENQLKVFSFSLMDQLQHFPLLQKFFRKPQWIQNIALAQVQAVKPDIVYMQDLSVLTPKTLKKIKQHCKLLVGQIACPFPSQENLQQFDLILTSFPHYVDRFKRIGISSEYFKIAFDPRILQKVKPQKRIYDLTFVGSFSSAHSEGTKLLEVVARSIPIHVWGQGIDYLDTDSPLRKNYHGQAWGLEMYKILAQSKIVINRHIDVAENYANNMRLYETTGMGAMLLTDSKHNLNDLFNIDREIITYKNTNELLKKIGYFLNNDEEREKIAKQGQKRTLTDHTYNKRMEELIQILDQYLDRPRSL